MTYSTGHVILSCPNSQEGKNMTKEESLNAALIWLIERNISIDEIKKRNHYNNKFKTWVINIEDLEVFKALFRGRSVQCSKDAFGYAIWEIQQGDVLYRCMVWVSTPRKTETILLDPDPFEGVPLFPENPEC